MFLKYEFIAAQIADWVKAENNCQKLGSNIHLASVNSPMEWAWVVAQAHVKHISGFWIGLNDRLVNTVMPDG